MLLERAAMVMLTCAACAPAPASVSPRFDDCDPALVSRLILEGALVIEVRPSTGAARVQGAIAASPDEVGSVVDSQRQRARCGVVLYSTDGELAASAKEKLAASGIRATNLGGVGGWKYVREGSRAALAGRGRPACVERVR